MITQLRTFVLASALPPLVASCGLLSSLSGLEETRTFAIPAMNGDATVVWVENRDVTRIVELSEKKTDFETLAAVLPAAPPVAVTPVEIERPSAPRLTTLALATAFESERSSVGEDPFGGLDVIGNRTLLSMTRRTEAVELARAGQATGGPGIVALSLTRELKLGRLRNKYDNHSGDAGTPAGERIMAQVARPALVLTGTLAFDRPVRKTNGVIRVARNFQAWVHEKLVLSLAQMLAI